MPVRMAASLWLNIHHPASTSESDQVELLKLSTTQQAPSVCYQHKLHKAAAMLVEVSFHRWTCRNINSRNIVSCSHISCSSGRRSVAGRTVPVFCKTSLWSPGTPSRSYPCRSAACLLGWSTSSLTENKTKSVNQCFSKPEMLSSNVYLCPQRKDIQFSVTELANYWRLIGKFNCCSCARL